MGLTKLFDKILRAGEAKKVRDLASLATGIGELESVYQQMSDQELGEQTELFRKRYWGSAYQSYCAFRDGELGFDADGNEVFLEEDKQKSIHIQTSILTDTTPLYPDGESLDELLPEVFATMREAAKRILGQRHFDVQLMGGAALFNGNIAEMKTGEGKTLVATLPAYLASISGLGVHVVTVNDYLAQYQSELMGRIFRFLNVSVGCILTSMNSNQRREAYAKDITYGTNNEFGFDYLRDNMAEDVSQLVQRGHNFAIVDEVDSILIDEARTPLIISGHAEGNLDAQYKDFARFVTTLERTTNIDPNKVYLPGEEKPIPNGDYEVDEKKRTVSVLDSAIDKLEAHLGIDNLYDAVNTSLVQFLQNAIKAKELFHRDKDYIVQSGEVKIVDEHTGRVLDGRRYSEGMHQAIEAKEGVEIQAENQTYATVTLQNYFRLYSTLCGMTGTAETEAAEFMSTYKLGVIPIPTNKPMIRQDQSDYIFRTESGKFDAIIQDVKVRHESGQPVLLGTASVEKSELLSHALKVNGIKHNVLNAKQHSREASVIAMAGRKGAVTVATNMAGRGTDIMLGGNVEYIAHDIMTQQGFDAQENPQEYEENWQKAMQTAKQQVEQEHNEVVELGGLYVIGTERHESRRIDNQLRGRSGRQGDPGESRFYISMEDDLMRLFNTAMMQNVMAMGIPEDQPIENSMITKSVERAQRQVEGRNFEIRKEVLKYDEVMNRQREVIYAERRKVLLGANISQQIAGFIENAISKIVVEYTSEGAPETWDLDKMWRDVSLFYQPSFKLDELIDDIGSIGRINAQNITKELVSDASLQYASKFIDVEASAVRQIERYFTLSVLDVNWRDHLASMDYLREGIGLRAMAQKDPLVEYTNESAIMFRQMNSNIQTEVARALLNLSIDKQSTESDQHIDDEIGQNLRSQNRIIITGQSGPADVDNSNAFTEMAKEDEASNSQKPKKTVQKMAVSQKRMIKEAGDPYLSKNISKNAPCPCGSGKKYKLCHGRNS